MNKAIIIGCGCVGAFTALEMSKSNLSTMLIEAAPEPAFGTTNANSGIVHSSHNTQPNTLKFTLVDSGNREIKRLSTILNYGYKQCGEIVVIQCQEQMPKLEEMIDLAKAQNLNIELLNKEKLQALEPNVVGFAGLLVKDAGVVNPYEMTQAVWNTAAANGVVGKFNEKVTSIEKIGELWQVKTNKGCYESEFVVNCAGLFAEEISKMALKDANRVKIMPRKGEEYLLDKDCKDLVHSIIFPLPSGNSKGTLVIPTVDGTIMVGPTAQQTEDKSDRSTTAEGREKVFAEARKLVPSLNEATAIAYFTGIRASDESGDFIVEKINNFINLAGIQSPGLTASPILGKMGADFITKNRTREIAYVPLHTKFINGDKEALIREDGNHSKIVCGCEMVSLADVHNAITDGARTLDGIKTRSRAGMGRCQGGFCTETVAAILAARLGAPKSAICKNVHGSNLISSEVDGIPCVQELEDALPYHAVQLADLKVLVKSKSRDAVIAQIEANHCFDVVVLGAGPAGLAAASSAAALGKSVLVLEKGARAGGILVQCIHGGFGLRKYKQELTGPEYAELLESDCLQSNASILMHSFVFQCAETGGGYTISTVTRGLGVRHFSAKALISCMGCRERSRAGVRIPGTRPAGVYSAGLAQQMINMDGQLPGKNVVILGSGDIGLIMARRCTLEGARVLGVYELLPRCSGLQRNVEQCLTDFGIPLHLSTTVVNIIGEPRITAVDLAPVDPVTLQPDLTKTTRLECDCLLLSVGLIPQAKVAVTLGGKVNPKTRLIEVDSFKRVSGRFFTAGNCLQVHDLADDAAEEGHDAGRAAALLLETSVAPGTLVVQTDENVLFSVPQFLIKELDSQSISIRVNKILGRCKVVARCGQEIVGETEVAHAVPAEMVHVRIKKVDSNVSIAIEKLEEVEVDKSQRQITCIVCPNGCNMLVKLGNANDIEEITGNQCKSGISYARQEIVEPFRTFSTSIAIENGETTRLPVKLSKPIPRNKLIEAAKKIRQCVVKAPIMMGDVVLKGIFGSKVVACCSVLEK
ncbi:Glycerol-3-phosphate dehydrogenase [Spironucleus salmonicida]|uniref:Glycerol-3-phosphate dehydrogenase n=1 Tax=Spironucleus salmonicida TaxID=348837 RepID=A0A9P8RWP8_9EUKA|nr:Glycerol-3-phosphate dehydrogenase [Spironucleus salmonicida]